MSAYKKMYGEKKEETKQTTMDIFLIRVTPPQEEPQAGLLECIPEEAIVIRDDPCMHVNTHEDFSIGQDMEVEVSDMDDPYPV